MADEATEEKTPYALLGGDDGVRQLVADFYELMDTLPEAAPIRAMHKGDLSEMSDKLGTFLIGWLGRAAALPRAIRPRDHSAGASAVPDWAERARPVALVHGPRAAEDLARCVDERATDGFIWAHGRDVPEQRLR